MNKILRKEVTAYFRNSKTKLKMKVPNKNLNSLKRSLMTLNHLVISKNLILTSLQIKNKLIQKLNSLKLNINQGIKASLSKKNSMKFQIQNLKQMKNPLLSMPTNSTVMKKCHLLLLLPTTNTSLTKEPNPSPIKNWLPIPNLKMPNHSTSTKVEPLFQPLKFKMNN